MSESPLNISISDFNYELPPEKIASFPLERREDSKLLIYRNRTISESLFKNISNFIPTNSVLVCNNTKVVNARLNFHSQTGHKIEVFCLGPATNGGDPASAMASKGRIKWLCLVGNLKRWKEGELSLTNNEITLKVKQVKRNASDFELEFNWTPSDLSFFEVIEKTGSIPIPPYLNRQSETLDKERYQTVFAKNEGSVAAPTASLHFTTELTNSLKEKGIGFVNLTLHVGAGTFKPVKSLTLAGHEMHPEWLSVYAEHIEELKSGLNKTLICVGTTALRVLESLYWMGLKTILNPNLSLAELEVSQWEVYSLNAHEIEAVDCLDALLNWMKKNGLKQLSCRTQILIAPPYQLKLAKGLVTNFHQPQSTLLLIIAALTGTNWKTIYEYALQNNFRFLSYGDSSLLLK